MLDKLFSVQDIIGLGIVIGALIKVYQFWREGKL